MKYTPEELTRLATAAQEIRELKSFVIKRAITHAQITGGKKHLLVSGDYYRNISEQELFNFTKKSIHIEIVDTYASNPGRGQGYDVPRDFVFSPPGETELKWEQYLALKAELGQ